MFELERPVEVQWTSMCYLGYDFIYNIVFCVIQKTL